MGAGHPPTLGSSISTGALFARPYRSDTAPSRLSVVIAQSAVRGSFSPTLVREMSRGTGCTAQAQANPRGRLQLADDRAALVLQARALLGGFRQLFGQGLELAPLKGAFSSMRNEEARLRALDRGLVRANDAPGDRYLDQHDALLEIGAALDELIALDPSFASLPDQDFINACEKENVQAYADQAARLRLEARDMRSAAKSELCRQWFGFELAPEAFNTSTSLAEIVRCYCRREQLPEPTFSRMREVDRLAGSEPTAQALQRASDEAEELRRQAAARLNLLRREREQAFREAMIAALSELRPMGGQLQTTPGRSRRGKAVRELVKDAARFFPADWIDDSNRNGAAPVEWRDDRRGNYDDLDGRMRISSSGSKVPGDPSGFGTAVHEFSHRMEDLRPQLRVAEWVFYNLRARGGDLDAPLPKPVKLQTLKPGCRYRKGELTRPAGFDDPYCGKAYANDANPFRSFEILSMGMENLVTRDDFEPDVEYRQFLLGLLAAL